MKYLLLFVIGIFSVGVNAQSFSGNLYSNASESSLSYGNVDIYQNDVLIASVLTDELGNFSVALDTGSYKCVFNYAGHLSITKNINVKSDEKLDFGMDKDPSKPEPEKRRKGKKASWTYSMDELSIEEAEIAPVYGARVEMAKKKMPEGLAMGYGDGDFDLPPVEGRISDRKKGRSGALTAGEINDFSKWKMWNDLSKQELRQYVESWKIAPFGRYTLELQNPDGLPIADAKVDLVSKSEGVIYTARTDNTGKAELWANLRSQVEKTDLSMAIDYRGIKKTIRKVKPFDKGVNHYELDILCQENYNVDIAFVVDATGSMGDELSYLQAEMNDVIFKSKQISDQLNFHFANVFYRDKGDEYVTKSMDFSRVLSESVQFIDEQYAAGGGDYEEAVETALDEAINKLSWNETARARVLFLILDAPPHNSAETREKMAQLTKQAAEKGIRIVPVGASGINKSTEYLLRTLAIGTNGTYTFLTDHSGIGNAHIKPSTDTYKVETFNDLMVRILKSYTYMPDCEQNIPDLDLDYPDSTVNVYQTDSITEIDSLAVNDSIPNRDSLDVIIDNPEPQLSWSYYPNPTTGIINIKANTDIDELFLTDLSGKLLKSIKRLSKDRIHQMDLSEYVTGIYLIRYLHKDRWISGKIVLQR